MKRLEQIEPNVPIESNIKGQKEWLRDSMGYQNATWHGHLVAGIIATYPRAVYIEIGILHGECWQIAAPLAVEAHGVDVEDYSQYMDGIGRFWYMRSEEFFKVYDGTSPDVIFVDGCHEEPTCREDIQSAFELLAPGGVVIMHDTWPVNKDNECLCGQVWKVRKQLESDSNIECFTFPRFPGLTIARPL